MTRDEAIIHFEAQAKCNYAPTREAAKIAIAALCAQQTPAKLDRSRWEGCTLCRGVTGWTQDLDDEHHEVEFLFCPVCGRPLTEEARAELEWNGH